MIRDDLSHDEPSATSALQTTEESFVERRFWRHAAALLVLLLCLVPLLDYGYVTIPDEGVYAAQAARLADGTWRADRVAPDIDPEGYYEAMFGIVLEDSVVYYHRHPAYPAILSVFFRLGDVTGMLVLSAIGTWLASVAGARLALRLGAQLAIPALWILGVGSPLIFYGYQVVAQSLAAAAFGLLTLAIVRSTSDRQWWAVAAVVAATAALVLLRTEGVIAAGAVAASTGIIALRGDPTARFRLDVRGVAIALTVLATAALTYFVDNRWAGAVIGDASSVPTVTSRRPDALHATWAALLRPWHHSALTATYGVPLIAVAVPLGALVLRIRPRERLLVTGLLAIGGLSAVFLQFEQPNLVSGLLPAFPLLLAGLILVSRESLATPVARLMALSVAIAVPALLFTIYGDGGLTQWGGRFFVILLPVAVPVATAGLQRGAHLLANRRERVFSLATLVLLTVSLSVFSLRASTLIQHDYRRTVEATVELRDQTFGEQGLIAIAQVLGDGQSRMFWRQIEGGAQVLSLKALTPLPYVTAKAASEGYPGFVLLTDRPDLARLLLEEPFRRTGWNVLHREVVVDTVWTLMVIGPDGNSA